MLLTWENAERRRYYALTAGYDLFGDYLVTRYWGSTATRRGGRQTVYCGTGAGASKVIAKINRERLAHGYLALNSGRILRH